MRGGQPSEEVEEGGPDGDEEKRDEEGDGVRVDVL